MRHRRPGYFSAYGVAVGTGLGTAVGVGSGVGCLVVWPADGPYGVSVGNGSRKGVLFGSIIIWTFGEILEMY